MLQVYLEACERRQVTANTGVAAEVAAQIKTVDFNQYWTALSCLILSLTSSIHCTHASQCMPCSRFVAHNLA